MEEEGYEMLYLYGVLKTFFWPVETFERELDFPDIFYIKKPL